MIKPSCHLPPTRCHSSRRIHRFSPSALACPSTCYPSPILGCGSRPGRDEESFSCLSATPPVNSAHLRDSGDFLLRRSTPALAHESSYCLPAYLPLGWPGIPVTKCSMDCTKTYLTAQTRPCCLNLKEKAQHTDPRLFFTSPDLWLIFRKTKSPPI